MRPHRAGRDRANRELSVGADIPQRARKRDRDREPGENQRSRISRSCRRMRTSCRMRLRRAQRTRRMETRRARRERSRSTRTRAPTPRAVSQSRTASVARPRHQQAKPLGIALVRTRLANFSAADHHQPPADREQLVEVARNQQHRAAAPRRSRESCDALRRSRRDRVRGSYCARRSFAAADAIARATSRRWRFPPESAPASRLGTRRANLKTLDQLARQIDRARSVQPSMRRHPLPERTRENQIFPQAHVEDQPVEVAILRYHRHRAGCDYFPRRSARAHRRAIRPARSARCRRRRQSRQSRRRRRETTSHRESVAQYDRRATDFRFAAQARRVADRVAAAIGLNHDLADHQAARVFPRWSRQESCAPPRVRGAAR